MALCNETGWNELQSLFKSLRVSLDDAVSSEEWGSFVYQNEELRSKYFGDVSPEDIIDQFNRLDADGKSELDWPQFVDGAISLGAAVMLGDALATAEGEAELKELFDTIEFDEDGRVFLVDWQATLLANSDVLARYAGLDDGASPRFGAFAMTGRFDVWIEKTFRRLGFNENESVPWDEFLASARATSAS